MYLDFCGFLWLLYFVSFNTREDLNTSHSDNNSKFEANWIEIKSESNKNFLITVVYRHPQKGTMLNF